MNTQSDVTIKTTIRIGYSLSLTGPVAENTKAAKLAHQLWEADINSRGGLLGRRVELICIDDQGDASMVPGIAEGVPPYGIWFPTCTSTLLVVLNASPSYTLA